MPPKRYRPQLCRLHRLCVLCDSWDKRANNRQNRTVKRYIFIKFRAGSLGGGVGDLEVLLLTSGYSIVGIIRMRVPERKRTKKRNTIKLRNFDDIGRTFLRFFLFAKKKKKLTVVNLPLACAYTQYNILYYNGETFIMMF